MTFKPTHITSGGAPLQSLETWQGDSEEGAPVHRLVDRAGDYWTRSEDQLFPLGSAEAREILAEITGADQAAAVAEATSDRVLMAEWAGCLDDARSTLAEGIMDALEPEYAMPSAARARLTVALSDAANDLAKFRP